MASATRTRRQPQLRQLLAGLTAVRGGDFSTRLPEGRDPLMNEIAAVFNGMNEQLGVFASEVTRVAREVGTEGRLDGQAHVPGAGGTWRNLTDSVNLMAGNLSRQVRSITQVTTAVAKGDLTPSIPAGARGEVAELTDNINTMVRTLRATAEANERQDWLRTSLARIAGLTRGERDLTSVAELIMNELIPLIGAQQGAFFLSETADGQAALRLVSGYGLPPANPNGPAGPSQVLLGQSLIGQVAKTRRPIVLDSVPPGYARISSALGESSPVNVVIVPILFEGEVLGVIEAASLWPFTQAHREFLEQLTETIGVSVSTITASARTGQLLEESRRLTAEIKQARQEIGERERQLDQASRYKSQFLANMSHELRTPLNSLLVLARVLAENAEGNLTPKQAEYASIVHSSGSDLLRLINDILDLTKVEAGKMDIHPERFALSGLIEDLRGVFGPLTREKRLQFTIDVAPGVPDEAETDMRRLRQILYNLLSNAVKFTEHGHVQLRIDTAGPRRAGTGPTLVFSVTDTGIGISRDDLATIFSAFQQADGTTSRRYGGTGLGLAICREVATRLGGEVSAQSEPGVGSTFRLRLPLPVPGAAHPRSTARQLIVGPEVSVAAATAKSEPVQPAGTHEALRGHTVLVVDDDPRNAFALTGVLQTHGITVIQATEGRKAITELLAGGIDLVLMDVMMPRMDGYATTRAIRQMPQFANLPVITVTARATQGDREKSIDAGASDYITKPIDVGELLACMERWVTPSPEAAPSSCS